MRLLLSFLGDDFRVQRRRLKDMFNDHAFRDGSGNWQGSTAFKPWKNLAMLAAR